MRDKTYNIALREELAQQNEEMMFAEGYDHCIIWTSKGRAVYSVEKIIQTLMEDDCTEEEALEHFEYNIEGSYVGEYTPIYVHSLIEEPPAARDRFSMELGVEDTVLILKGKYRGRHARITAIGHKMIACFLIAEWKPIAIKPKHVAWTFSAKKGSGDAKAPAEIVIQSEV